MALTYGEISNELTTESGQPLAILRQQALGPRACFNVTQSVDAQGHSVRPQPRKCRSNARGRRIHYRRSREGVFRRRMDGVIHGTWNAHGEALQQRHATCVPPAAMDVSKGLS